MNVSLCTTGMCWVASPRCSGWRRGGGVPIAAAATVVGIAMGILAAFPVGSLAPFLAGSIVALGAVAPRRLAPPTNSRDSDGLVPRAAVAVQAPRVVGVLGPALLPAHDAEVRHVEPARWPQPDWDGDIWSVEPPAFVGRRLNSAPPASFLVTAVRPMAASSATVLGSSMMSAGSPFLMLSPSSVTRK